MIAEAWGLIRNAGSWVVALVAALLVVAWLWQAYRSATARADEAEARVDRLTSALAVSVQAARTRADALRRAERELSEIHVAMARDKGRIMAFAAELEEIAGPERAGQIWDRVFDRAPEDPAAIARERSIAP
jgi:hypothetical protein